MHGLGLVMRLQQPRTRGAVGPWAKSPNRWARMQRRVAAGKS
jgi:hypothetical protein